RVLVQAATVAGVARALTGGPRFRDPGIGRPPRRGRDRQVGAAGPLCPASWSSAPNALLAEVVARAFLHAGPVELGVEDVLDAAERAGHLDVYRPVGPDGDGLAVEVAISPLDRVGHGGTGRGVDGADGDGDVLAGLGVEGLDLE